MLEGDWAWRSECHLARSFLGTKTLCACANGDDWALCSNLHSPGDHKACKQIMGIQVALDKECCCAALTRQDSVLMALWLASLAKALKGIQHCTGHFSAHRFWPKHG